MFIGPGKPYNPDALVNITMTEHEFFLLRLYIKQLKEKEDRNKQYEELNGFYCRVTNRRKANLTKLLVMLNRNKK